MSEKGTQGKGAQARAAERRARFVAADAPSRNRAGVLPLVALAVGIGLLVMGVAMLAGVGRQAPSGPVVANSGAAGAGDAARRAAANFTTLAPAPNGKFTFPAADFADGKARFYTVAQGGKEIDFFVVKSSDGVLRAAIDSCDVCYQARRGYRQEGDEMVCNNCGQRFASVKINEVKGGCNPVPLTRTVQGDTLIIEQSDLVAEGSRYF